MEHRSRSAAIIVEGDSVLPVKHRHPQTGREWWVPPGGGLQHPESIYDCAWREMFEETGLSVELGEVVYIREFVELERQIHHLEIFIMATSHSGTVTIENLVADDLDSEYIQEARFVSKEEMEGIIVYPEVLKDSFWEEIKGGLSSATYLGLQWEGR